MIKKIGIPGLLGLGLLGLALGLGFAYGGAGLKAMEEWSFWVGDRYDQWFPTQPIEQPLILLLLAFGGGLVSSISPCILSLLPVNLSYIGTQEIQSRWDALAKATLFVLGVVTMVSLFGLFAAFGGAVLVQYQGYVQVAVGSLILVMALVIWGVIRLPLPQKSPRLSMLGAYGVGLTFALVSSPCTSPVMFTVLAAGSATGSPFWSTLTMVSYALGYTAIIFFASLFTGLVKRTRWLLHHSELITRLSGAMLLLVGLFYLVNGGQWIFSVLTLPSR